MVNLTTIGFDADDTLWHNERFFHQTHERFAAILASHADTDRLRARLLETERRNIPHYGYGVKGFVLSMIEAAIDETDGRVPAAAISQLVEAGREMLSHPVELLPHAREVLEETAASHRVLLITKGDLLHQERKLAQSGLADTLHGVEIVSGKSREVYEEIFSRHGDGPERAMMVGNSIHSDVRPALEAGSWGVHVPHELRWEVEHEEAPQNAPRFREIPDLGALPELVAQIG